jgi:hypothetical protein
VCSLHILNTHPFFTEDRDDDSNLDYLARAGRIINRRRARRGQLAKITYVSPEINLRRSWTVRHIGNRTFLVMLDCTPHDPKAAAYDQVVSTLVASISLVPVTPPPATATPTPRSWLDNHSCSCDTLDCNGESAPPCTVSCAEGEEAECLCAWCNYDRGDEAYELVGSNDCSCRPEGK